MNDLQLIVCKGLSSAKRAVTPVILYLELKELNSLSNDFQVEISCKGKEPYCLILWKGFK